jgi:hypothetical protein
MNKLKYLIVAALLCAVIILSYQAGKHSINRYEFKSTEWLHWVIRCDRATGEAERLYLP